MGPPQGASEAAHHCLAQPRETQGFAGPPSWLLRSGCSPPWAQLRLTARVPWGKGVQAPYPALRWVQPENLPTFPDPTKTSAFPVLHFSSGSVVANLGVPWVRSVRCVWWVQGPFGVEGMGWCASEGTLGGRRAAVAGSEGGREQRRARRLLLLLPPLPCPPFLRRSPRAHR